MSGTMKRSKKVHLGLPGRLLEVAIVIGMDEETGLINRSYESMRNEKCEDLWEANYQPHLLDIVSGAQVGNNMALMNINGKNTYHPQDWRKNLRRVSQQNRKQSNTPPRRMKSIRKLRQRANRDEEVPLSTDFLSNLPNICLPDDSRVYQTERSSSINFLVLTDLSGTRHYAATLTYYRTFFTTKASDSKVYRLIDSRQPKPYIATIDTCEEWKLCHVPQCICFVSELPYFDVLRTCLSCLQKEAKPFVGDSETYRKILQKYVTNMSIILSPPPSISLNFTLCGLPIRLCSSDDPAQPNFISDFHLQITHQVFVGKEKQLFEVLAHILLEHRLVFVSSNYSLITLTIETLLSHLRPFTWPHQYVPVLFSEIIDMVACPGIFIMGCHSCHKEEIKSVDNEQIVVDLDTGTLTRCAAFDVNNGVVASCRDYAEPTLPQSIVKKTTCKLEMKRMSGNLAATKMSRPSAVSIEEMKREEMEDRDQCNIEIQQIFMAMMVDLFGDAITHLDYETNQFQTDKFLENVLPEDLPFYSKVTKTYMFRKFIQERLKRTHDKFERLAQLKEKKIPLRSKPGRKGRSNSKVVRSMFIPPVMNGSGGKNGKTLKKLEKMKRHNSTTTSGTLLPLDSSISEPFSMRKVVTDLPFEKVKTTIYSITLPTFPKQGTNFDAGHFYKRCVELVDDILSKIPIPSSTNNNDDDDAFTTTNDVTSEIGKKRAALLIFRGCYYIANSDYKRGLQDLHATAKEDYSMFPESSIKKIMTSLDDDVRQLMRSETFYEGDQFYDGGKKRHESSSYFKGQDLPYNALEKCSFARILEKSDISSEEEIINQLFVILSVDQNKVDPEIFAAFYQTWKQSRHECEMAARSITEANLHGVLQESEVILKISQVVWSNRSNGRLIITNRKILFFTDGYYECKVMVRFTDIRDMKIGKHKNLFRTKSTLVIKYDEDATLKVGLGTETEIWLAYVEELKIGRILSRDWKDHSMSLISATQNVIIADSLYQVAKDEVDFMSIEEARICVKKFCKLTKLQESGQLNAVPLQTFEMLVLRIDSAPKESKKTSVENILYSSTGSSRIWVALQSGKIRMVDGTSWSLDTRPIKDCSGKLTCMLMANSQELWVGSEDRNIYVIKIDQMKKNRVLHEHASSLVSIVQCAGHVVSASSDGMLKVWKEGITKSQRSINVIQQSTSLLSVTTLLSRYLCCCTSQSIMISTTEGHQLQRLSTREFFTSSISDSHITACTCTEDGQIWCGDSCGAIYVWYKRKTILTLTEDVSVDERIQYIPRSTVLLFGVDSQRSVTCLLPSTQLQMWIGDSHGDITIVDIESVSQERVLQAHDARVTCLCAIENRYVVSGSASKDGKIAVWRSSCVER